MALEDLLSPFVNTVKVLKTRLKSGIDVLCETAIHHPLATGYFVCLSAAAYEVFTHNNSEETVLNTGLIAGTIVYLACKLIKEYLFDAERKKADETASRLCKSKYLLINNATMSAVAGSTVVTLATSTTDQPVVYENLHFFLFPYAVFYSFCRMLQYQDELKRLYKQKAVQASKFQRAVDYFLERPSILSSIAGTSSFAGFAQNASFGYQMGPVNTFVINALVAASVASIAYFCGLGLSALFHSQSREYARLALKAKWQAFNHRYNAAVQTLTVLEKIVSQQGKAGIQLQKSELMIKKGDYDAGIIQLKELLRRDGELPARNPFELFYEPFRILGASYIKSMIDFFAGILFSRKKIAELGLLSYKEGKLATADYLMRRSAKDKQNLDNQVLYLFFLDARDDELSAQKQLQQILSLCAPDKFRKFADSTDDRVLEYDSPGFTRTILIKKNKKSLWRKYACTKLFYKPASDKEIIEQALACTQSPDGEFNYLAVARVKGTTLFEFPNREQKLDEAIELLAEATQKANGYFIAGGCGGVVLDLDYLGGFKKFVSRVTSNPELQDELFNSGLLIPMFLSRQKRSVIHGNSHSRNMVVASRTGKLCLIDFGDVCRADFGLDVEGIVADIAPNAERIPIYEKCSSLHSKEKSVSDAITKYAYARAFKAGHLLGRNIFYQEGGALKYYDNLVSAIKGLIALGEEPNALQKFLDAVGKVAVIA